MVEMPEPGIGAPRLVAAVICANRVDLIFLAEIIGDADQFVVRLLVVFGLAGKRNRTIINRVVNVPALDRPEARDITQFAPSQKTLISP